MPRDANVGRDSGSVCPSSSPDELSGTRLKLAGVEFGDGQRWVNTLYDSQLDAYCSPVAWSDGNTYCVPSGLATLGFTDAACTQPVALANECLSAPVHYVLDYTQNACNDDSYQQLYTLGSQNSATSYYALYDGVCGGPVTLPTGFALYDLGQKVPVSDLAILSTRDGSSGSDGLALRSYISTDGVIEDDTLVDTTLGVMCAPQVDPLAIGTTTCQPLVDYTPVYYGNNSCSGPAYAIRGCTGTMPAFATVSATCPDLANPVSYYPITGPTDAPAGGAWQTIADEGCEETPVGSSASYYAVSSSPVTLPSVTVSPLTDACHRVEIVRASGRDASISTRAYDKQLGAGCYPAMASDGVERCLPNGAVGWNSLYSDAACTSPIDVIMVYVNNPPCPTAVPAYGLISTGLAATACSGEAVYAVGSAFTGPLYSMTNDGCQLYDLAFDTVAYTLQGPLANDSFLTVTPFHD